MEACGFLVSFVLDPQSLQFVTFQESDIDSSAVHLVRAICTCRSGARFFALVSLRLREHSSSLVASAPVLSCLPVSIRSLLQLWQFQESDIDSPAVHLVRAICTCRSGARFSALVSLRLREHTVL